MNRKLRVDLYMPRPPVGCVRYAEPSATETFHDLRYTVERRGGCTVFRLGEKVRLRSVPPDPGKGAA
jgi:hypothetical protein